MKGLICIAMLLLHIPIMMPFSIYSNLPDLCGSGVTDSVTELIVLRKNSHNNAKTANTLSPFLLFLC